MGFAMACQLLTQGHTVVCLSRRSNEALIQHAHGSPGVLLQWQHDLSDSRTACTQLHDWLGQQSASAWDEVALINNAGMIPPIGSLGSVGAEGISQALRVGLEAPMQLCATFLNATQAWAGLRKVLNISSGLGRKAMASQAPYCAAKAGMDHFTRCVALEEATKPNGAKVCSLAPGVIDTDMQQQLRGADPALFPDQTRFAELSREGQLASATQAAERVLAFLARPTFGSQPVADVRD